MHFGIVFMSRLSKEIAYQCRYALPVWLITILMNWLPDNGPIIRLRGFFISIFLQGRPKKLLMGRDVTLLSLNRLELGNHIYIAKGSWINAIGGIKFEDEVVLGGVEVILFGGYFGLLVLCICIFLG